MESRRNRIATGLAIAAIGLIGTGCFERALRPVNPCTRANVGETISVESVDEVDLLFMIDNSNSMAEEQASITAEIPRLVRILATGDSSNPPDGTQDFAPVRSLHIGVITSDMGTGGNAVPTCDRGTFGTRLGDDGILLTRSRVTGCMATFPAIFDFNRGEDADAFAANVACVATTGTGGCGFEQQLDAVLKAVSPSAPTEWTIPDYAPPLFFESTPGHADDPGTNGGFIRTNSALAIIMVTDEEDCSAVNPDIFNPSSATFGGTDLNLRCFTFPNASHPVERYVRGVDGRSGLIALRQNPSLLIFAGIVGVPVDAVPTGTATPDYAAILDRPDMAEVIDPAMPTRLTPSCNVPGRGIAFPPRRIVRVAQGLQLAGASTTIQSICQDNYGAALDAIIEKIADALGGACLPRDLNPDAEGFVGCEVFEVLPATGATTTCDGLPGRIAEGAREVIVNDIPRQMCPIVQVGPVGFAAGEQGWFYQTAEDSMDPMLIEACGATGQRIKFTFNPITNSDIRLECLQTVAPSTGGTVSIGSFCTPGGDATTDMCPMGYAPNRSPDDRLACDAADRTCAFRCTDTSDCTRVGLLGDVCDTRSWEDAVGANDPEVTDDIRNQRRAAIPDVNGNGAPDEGDWLADHGFCVNPTCI